MFYEQFKKIRKAKAMLAATNSGIELTKAAVHALYTSAKRENQIKTAYTLSVTKQDAGGTPEDFYSRPKAVRKPKAVKEPKEDTKEITLALFREGKTPMEIALVRKMTQGTVEGHLAYFVAKQEIKGSEVLSPRKLATIFAAIIKLKSIKMNEIREHLGRDYGFGEIKIAIATHLAEEN